MIEKIKKNNMIHKLFGCTKKPIISRYVSFTQREIMFECPICNKRYSERIRKNYGESFPIDTNHVDKNTFDAILNGSEYIRITNTTIRLK
jgi:hypothetical protein